MNGTRKISNKTTMKTKNSPIAPKEEIDFLFPKEGQKITIDDFKAMVKEAEKGPFFTQEEFDKEINEWLKKEICK